VDLTEARRLEAAATPGPWRVLEDDDPEGTSILGGGEEGSIAEGQVAFALRWEGEHSAAGSSDRNPDEANAALLVHLRNHATDYFDAVEQRDQLREALGEAVNALEWCDRRYRQTLSGKPVRDVGEMRAYIGKTLTLARTLLRRLAEQGENE
jgi:hypothetical protein